MNKYNISAIRKELEDYIRNILSNKIDKEIGKNTSESEKESSLSRINIELRLGKDDFSDFQLLLEEKYQDESLEDQIRENLS